MSTTITHAQCSGRNRSNPWVTLDSIIQRVLVRSFDADDDNRIFQLTVEAERLTEAGAKAETDALNRKAER